MKTRFMVVLTGLAAGALCLKAIIWPETVDGGWWLFPLVWVIAVANEKVQQRRLR